MDRTICAKESSPAKGCLTRGRSSNRSGSSRSERFSLGRRSAGLGTRSRCRARAAHVKQTPMCAKSRFRCACRRLRMPLSGLWLLHGLRGGCAALEPEAVAGATPFFRCLPWHLRRLGCVLHPNLRGGRSGPAIPCGKAKRRAGTGASRPWSAMPDRRADRWSGNGSSSASKRLSTPFRDGLLAGSDLPWRTAWGVSMPILPDGTPRVQGGGLLRSQPHPPARHERPGNHSTTIRRPTTYETCEVSG